ncbi:zinc finger CCCH domain-containing protein 66-like [Magnolia sinica]|uniref:zinc finger CCCH domain-containing protein 66-like n=1 Tax=Magnolia sinica TaxID=86752 RepID=UPI0026583007|nr:zinc finger CCCH domain-containing protein 66-like [Magnolia sinica]
MPDNWQNENNAVSTSSNASATDNLEGAMWRLKIQVPDNQEGVDGNSSPYPDRPGEPDCIYYLRTGLCGYGSNCRFNHPTNTGQATQPRGELPERVGQPDCQFFLKTGTCKFGATCKYHHPRDRHGVGQVPLNMLGLPMRQEEKSCAYYMRTGSCKFGIACKFHHPQPAALGTMLPITASAYGATGSSGMPPSSLPYVGGLPAWSLPRAPYTSGPRVQGPPAYMPVVLSSQGMMPAQQGWSTYTSSVSPISSSDALGSNLAYNAKHPADPGSSGQLQLLSASVQHLPERPDQPECQYYMKTGSCKYGPSCKYHHPKEKNAPLAMGTLGPLGLPLRPGQATCTFYSMYGICKYGSACKFDHPMAGYYNYSLPTLSIPGPSPVLYQRNSQIARSTSETSPSKVSKLSDRPTKPEATATKQPNADAEAPDQTSQQTFSPSHTAPTSESPHDQSD